MQDALILYARLQLNLTRDVSEASSLVEQLLDLVCKELDQSSLPGAGVPRSVFLSIFFFYSIYSGVPCCDFMDGCALCIQE